MNLDVGSFAEPELPLLTVAGYREAKIVVLHPPPSPGGQPESPKILERLRKPAWMRKENRYKWYGYNYNLQSISFNFE